MGLISRVSSRTYRNFPNANNTSRQLPSRQTNMSDTEPKKDDDQKVVDDMAELSIKKPKKSKKKKEGDLGDLKLGDKVKKEKKKDKKKDVDDLEFSLGTKKKSKKSKKTDDAPA